MKPLLHCLGVAATLFVLVFARAAEPKVFRAGAAVGDITPELGSILIGGFSPTPAKHVHDPLLVRGLVLDDGASRLALVVCDNIGLPLEVCDEAKRLIQERTALPTERVMILSTHTHSGPSAGTETSLGPNLGRGSGDIASYQKVVATRIADTVHNAMQQLEPARIGWGKGTEPTQVFNRRWFTTDEALRRNPFGGVDRVRMNPPAGSPALERPAGPTDPEILFLSVQATDGRPIALFASYALHYVGGVPAGVVSADYFALVCARLGELLNAGRVRDPLAPPFVGLMANGASGDVNNIDFRAKRAALPPFDQMNRVANRVAAEIHRAYQQIEHRDWVELDARLAVLDLPSRKPSPEMIARAQELLASPAGGPGWHPLEKAYANRVLQRAAAPTTVRAPVQALRIGDVAMLSMPVEPFAALGMDLKAKSPFAQTFALGLANAYYGYMPTLDQVSLGGYETWIGTNRLEPAAGTTMIESLIRFAHGMKPAPAETR